jgi:hypothetical protein
MKRMGTLIMKTKLDQKEALQTLSSLKNITHAIETDLKRVRQTQTEIEIDLKKISTLEGPVTVHQIGNNYFCKKRKHQMLSAVIKERQKLEQLHKQHLEKLNSAQTLLAQTTKRLGHLSEKAS